MGERPPRAMLVRSPTFTFPPNDTAQPPAHAGTAAKLDKLNRVTVCCSTWLVVNTCKQGVQAQ